MSGKLQPPLLTPTQAQTLLDQVVYEQVLECVDLDALHRVQRSLTIMMGELDGVPDDHVEDMAADMLDRVLARMPRDLRNYLQAASWAPFGGCELCEAEAENEAENEAEEEARPVNQAPARRASARLKS